MEIGRATRSSCQRAYTCECRNILDEIGHDSRPISRSRKPKVQTSVANLDLIFSTPRLIV